MTPADLFLHGLDACSSSSLGGGEPRLQVDEFRRRVGAYEVMGLDAVEAEAIVRDEIGSAS